MEGAAGQDGSWVVEAEGQHLHRAEEEEEGWQQQMGESRVAGAEAQGEEEVGSLGCCWLGRRRGEEGAVQGEEEVGSSGCC